MQTEKSMETLQSLVVQCDSGEVEFDWTYENQKQKKNFAGYCLSSVLRRGSEDREKKKN